MCIVLIINSLSVCLMTKSGFGISTISSVPYVLNKVFSQFSFGTWNYIFQTLLIVSLMILKRTFCLEYMISFGVGLGFGKMIDVHGAWLRMLPDTAALHVVYFIVGFLIMCFGICLANNCLMPITPTDVFPRDLSEILGAQYKQVKTVFDLSCLSLTLILSIFVLHGIYGIGAGTIFCAFATGKTISIFQQHIFKNHVTFYKAYSMI